MSTRPLRQYYDSVTATPPDEAVAYVEPWRRHRARFIEGLRGLSEEQWRATTRCSEWDAKDIVAHLVNVDAFWVVTLGNARAKQPPTKFVEGFDPSTGTDDLVGAMRASSTAETLERFTAGTNAFVTMVESFGPEDWALIGESPLGHLPARLLFGHAFWDSWLHERDIFEPLGLAAPVEPDELFAAVSFALLFAGLQGGLVGDTAPVGEGLSTPIDETLRFDDLPDTALRIEIGSGVRITHAAPTEASTSISALTLVESFTGRRTMSDSSGDLPPELAAHLARAALVL
jgi:uncharacterized protein (TIGR03083 family)